VLRGTAVVMTVWLVFVWSGLGPQLAADHGIHVSRTSVGHANRRVTKAFLFDDPPRAGGRGTARRRRANRRPTSGQPAHTRRG
jgi:hypothetical protein